MHRDSAGAILELTGTVQDITAYKEAELALRQTNEELQSLFNASPAAIVVFDTEARIRKWNPAAVQIFGWPEEEVLGKVNPVVPEAGREHFRKNFSDVLNGKVIHWEEIRPVRKDGTSLDIALEAAALYDTEGCVESVVTIMTDISDAREAARKLSQSLDEKELLLREVHHRVKNNMQVILSLLNRQSGAYRDSHDRELHQSSMNRIRAMASIHELLYASQDMTHVDMTAYLRTLTSNLSSVYHLDRERIRIVLELEHIELNVNRAIPCGLIINELLTNAIKHAFPLERSGEITVGFRRSGDEIMLSVHDTGIGYLRKPEDDAPSGSQGLTIVNLLVRQLKGKQIRAGANDIIIRFKGE